MQLLLLQTKSLGLPLCSHLTPAAVLSWLGHCPAVIHKFNSAPGFSLAALWDAQDIPSAVVQGSSPTNDAGSSPWGAGSCTASPAACKVPPLGKQIPYSLERLGAHLLGVTTWNLLLTQNQDFPSLSPS